MINKPIKSADVRALNILHKAMLTGQIIFALIAFYLVYSNSFQAVLQHLDKIFQVIAIVFSAAGVGLGAKLFKNKLTKINEPGNNPKNSFNEYRSAAIIQWAFVEAPCLFSIICFLLTGNYAFLALAIFMMVYFAMLAPSKVKIALQLKLNEQDISNP